MSFIKDTPQTQEHRKIKIKGWKKVYHVNNTKGS